MKYIVYINVFFSDIEIIIPTKVIPRLLQSAVDSDVESDVEFTDSETEDNVDYRAKGGNPSQRPGGWRSWCTLM